VVLAEESIFMLAIVLLVLVVQSGLPVVLGCLDIAAILLYQQQMRASKELAEC
jgi:hypothetical protein